MMWMVHVSKDNNLSNNSQSLIPKAHFRRAAKQVYISSQFDQNIGKNWSLVLAVATAYQLKGSMVLMQFCG